jgi:GNS1/SUR4 family
MFQFVTNMAQAAYCQMYSPYPKQLSTLLFVYMITLLALFLNFYLAKHGDTKRRRQPQPQHSHEKTV